MNARYLNWTCPRFPPFPAPFPECIAGCHVHACVDMLRYETVLVTHMLTLLRDVSMAPG